MRRTGTDDVGFRLVRECRDCAEDGTHPVTRDYPVFAGQPVKYPVYQTKGIRDGPRDNGLPAVMRAAKLNLTDKECETVAEWLASRC
jgi:cytochrome c553